MQASVRQTAAAPALSNSAFAHASESAMNQLLSRLSPSITNMIRMDHAHVLSHVPPVRGRTRRRASKKGLVDNDLRRARNPRPAGRRNLLSGPARHCRQPTSVDKSVPEHDQMRRLITQLRNLSTRPRDLRRDLLRADEQRHAPRRGRGDLAAAGRRTRAGRPAGRAGRADDQAPAAAGRPAQRRNRRQHGALHEPAAASSSAPAPCWRAATC